MVDQVYATHCFAEQRAIADIALDELELVPVLGEMLGAAAGQVIEDRHFGGLVKEQTIDKMAANETCSACNKDSHDGEMASVGSVKKLVVDSRI